MSELTDYLNYRCADMDYDIYSDAFDMAAADEELIEGLSKLVRDMLTHMRADGCAGCVFKSACDDGLSELVTNLIEDWMDNVCPTSFWCKRDGDYVHCEDERCGNLLYKQMARDLGVEI